MSPAKKGRKGVEEEWEGRIPAESSPRWLGKRAEWVRGRVVEERESEE